MLFHWLPPIAARNRNSPRLRYASYVMAATLVLLSILDIISTNMGLSAGAVEANRIMRWVQYQLGDWWFIVRLVAQMIPALMIIWYPHRLVLLVVAPVIPLVAFVVFNNLRLAGVFQGSF